MNTVLLFRGLVTKSCLILATPWTVAHQAPLSMGFSRQEYWSGLPFHSPGDLPDPGIEPLSPGDGLLHCRRILHQLSHQGSLIGVIINFKISELKWNCPFMSICPLFLKWRKLFWAYFSLYTLSLWGLSMKRFNYYVHIGWRLVLIYGFTFLSFRCLKL